MVVINGYKEHIAVINPLIHIASVPPYCASHFWSFRNCFETSRCPEGPFQVSLGDEERRQQFLAR